MGESLSRAGQALHRSPAVRRVLHRGLKFRGGQLRLILFQQQITQDYTQRTNNDHIRVEHAAGIQQGLEVAHDVEQVLDKVLQQVMDYLRLDVGEVFLREEDARALQLVLHRGSDIGKLWSRDIFRFGEGLVGQTAETGQLSQVEISPANAGLHNNGYSFNDELLTGRIRHLVCLPLSGRRGVSVSGAREGRAVDCPPLGVRPALPDARPNGSSSRPDQRSQSSPWSSS